MKFPPKKLETLIYNLPSNIKSILLYGSDNGAVQDKLNIIKENFLRSNTSEFSIIKFEYSLIKDQISLIKEAINNLDFGMSKKLILISNTSPTLDQEFKIILKNVPHGVLVIFLAEELGLNSSLRCFFEQEEDVIAIPNYIDEIEDLKKIAIKFFQENSYTFDLEFINFFCHSIFGNRSIFKNELEKIILFQAENKHIRLKDVFEVIPSCYEESQEAFLLDLMIQKQLIFKQKFDNFIAGISPINLLRALIHLIMRMHELKLLLNKNFNFQEASKQLSPQIFFKNLHKYELLVTKFTKEQIILMLEQLITIEKEIKISDIDFNSKMDNFFLKNLLIN